jgi:hypothetical protein
MVESKVGSKIGSRIRSKIGSKVGSYPNSGSGIRVIIQSQDTGLGFRVKI